MKTAQDAKHKSVLIYSKSGCPGCMGAKQRLDAWKIPYIEKDITKSEAIYKEFQKHGERRVPLIFIDGKKIGTFDEMARMGITEFLLKEEIVEELPPPVGLMDPSISYKPFRFPFAVELTKRHEQAHWVEDEIDLSDDINDWKGNKLSTYEKDFVLNILRLFTQSDVAVGKNYYEYYIPKFRNNEVRNMLGSFAAREGVHQRAYALLNDTLGLPESEFSAFMEYKEMSDKLDFMEDLDVESDEGLALALARSVFNEGVSLFASFVMLLNFERHGKMKGMCKVVEWSIRDETMHVEGITQLFKEFCKEKPHVVNDSFKRKIYNMARELLDLESKFIELAYGDNSVIQELKKEDVEDYLKYITDRRLLQLGLKPNFGVKKNPLNWLDWILNAPSHTNFFEQRVSDYEVGGLTGNWSDVY